jgi:hypothetical protein
MSNYRTTLLDTVISPENQEHHHGIGAGEASECGCSGDGKSYSVKM